MPSTDEGNAAAKRAEGSLSTASAAALVAALAIVAAYVTSAAQFALLPSAGTPLAELGWPAGRLNRPALVLIEPDGAWAWHLVQADPSSGEGATHAVRASLVDGRAQAVHELPRELGTERAHAYRDGRLLIVGRPPTAGSSRYPFLLIADDRVVARGELSPSVGGLRDPRLTNLAHHSAGGFAASFSGRLADGSAMAAAIVAISLEGEVGPVETEPLPLEQLSATARLVAAFPSPRQLLLVAHDGTLWQVRAGSVLQLEARSCTNSTECVLVESMVSLEQHRLPPYWLRTDGSLVPMADLGGAPEPQVPSGTYRVIPHLAPGRDPQWSTLVTADPTSTQRVLLRDGRSITLTAKFASLDPLLEGRFDGGVRQGLMRDVEVLPFQPFIAHDGGFLTMSFFGPHPRALALDGGLEPRSPKSVWARWGAIIADRYDFDPISTLVYLAVMAGALLVAAVAGWVLRRRRLRLPGAIALWGYAAVGALLLLAKGRYLFPSWW
jgi:hypothetical protein